MCDREGIYEAIKTINSRSYQDCILECTKTPDCLSVNFKHTSSECRLQSSLGAGITPQQSSTQHLAYQTEPPPIDAQDELTTACPTKCPDGDGQTYTSIYGEKFLINCGVRHGTAPIGKDKAESFKDCMDTCAYVTP